MKRLTGAAVAMGLATAVPVPARAQFYTGNEIYGDCQASESDAAYFQKWARCTSYVTGAFDAILLARQLNDKPDCTPDRLTVGQMRDVAVKYMREHPENRNMSAAAIVLLSIMDAWPCGSGK